MLIKHKELIDGYRDFRERIFFAFISEDGSHNPIEISQENLDIKTIFDENRDLFRLIDAKFMVLVFAVDFNNCIEFIDSLVSGEKNFSSKIIISDNLTSNLNRLLIINGYPEDHYIFGLYYEYKLDRSVKVVINR